MCWELDRGLPASRTERNKGLLVKVPVYVLVAHTHARTRGVHPSPGGPSVLSPPSPGPCSRPVCSTRRLWRPEKAQRGLSRALRQGRSPARPWTRSLVTSTPGGNAFGSLETTEFCGYSSSRTPIRFEPTARKQTKPPSSGRLPHGCGLPGFLDSAGRRDGFFLPCAARQRNGPLWPTSASAQR